MNDDQNKTTDANQAAANPAAANSDQVAQTPADNSQAQDHAEDNQKPQEDTQVQADENQVPAPSEQSKPEEEQTPAAPTEEKPNEPEVAKQPQETAEPEPSAEPEAETAEASTSDEEKTAQPVPAAPKQSDVPGAHWYVVHTYSGHEAKVAATLKQRVESQKLADKILDILVPTQEKIEIKEGKKTNIKEKIFPGYLLIRMVLDDSTWLAVRTTPGITSFVGNANKPTPLPEEEVAGIRKFMEMEAPTFKSTFSVGEAVKITDGPFSEFLGSINEIDQEKGKLKVMVSIFGRETPVELDFLQVAKL